MIAKYGAFADIVPMVRHHHERWDGSGYPAGLSGHKIPLGARILAVADSFDTITEARLYRITKLSPLEAVNDISSRAGTWYDPVIVDALRQLHGLDPHARPVVENRPPGLSLALLRRYPRFARLLLAITISSIGDPLTTVATLVSVYVVTGQPVAVAAAYIVRAAATVAVAGLAGAATDRFRRGPMIVRLEVARAALLLATPFLVHIALGWLFPLLFILAAINALVQPARQAAIADVVEPDDVGAANAAVSLTTVVGGFIGFPLAGLILVVTSNSTNWLFVADAVTFLIAALLVSLLGNLGGGFVDAKLHGAISRAWGNRVGRPHLLVAAGTAFFLSMSYPALIVLGYQQRFPGAQAYTILEAALALGIVLGSLYVGRISSIWSMPSVVAGIALTGIMSVLVAIAPNFWLIAALLMIASIGNPIYVVGNQTALLQAGNVDEHGTFMAIRFALVQVALISGSAVAGVITDLSSPRITYAVLGAGLCAVAVAAVLAYRRQQTERTTPTVTHKIADLNGDIGITVPDAIDATFDTPTEAERSEEQQTPVGGVR
jgi:MFS family permease